MLQPETITIEEGDIAIVFRASGGGELMASASVDENGTEIVHVHLDELVKLASVWFLSRVAQVMNSEKPGQHPMMRAILMWCEQARPVLAQRGIMIQTLEDYMAESEVRGLIHGNQDGGEESGGDVRSGEPD